MEIRISRKKHATKTKTTTSVNGINDGAEPRAHHRWDIEIPTKATVRKEDGYTFTSLPLA
jgi:hypothetical protein